MKEEEEIQKIHDLIEKWKKRLYINDIWEITICLEEMNAKGAIDLKEAEYYRADLLINEQLLGNDKEIEEIVIHELVHLVATDFFRCAMMSAKNDNIRDELRYKYEQFTTKLSKTLGDLNER